MFNRYKERVVAFIINTIRTPYFKIAVGLSVIIFIIWGIPAFGIYDYKELRKVSFLKKPYFSYVKMYRRYVNHNFLYDNIDEAKDDHGEFPKDFDPSDDNKYTEKDIISQIYSQLNLQFDLSQRTDYKGLIVKTKDSQMGVHIFLFDSFEKAKSVYDKLKNALDSLPEGNNLKKNMLATLKANCLIVFTTDNGFVRDAAKNAYEYKPIK